MFVFSMGGLEQNVNSLLTHVSDTVFHDLSRGSLHFVLHGSLINRLFQRFLLAVEENQPKMVEKATMESKTKATM